MDDCCHERHLLDGRKMACDPDGSLPDAQKRTLVAREFDQEAACPYECLGPFIW
jgi:hypothetical protein